MYLDESNFKVFYEDFFPQVRAYLFSKCQNINLAQDLSQEVFVRIWTNKEKIEIVKSRSYAFTVANNIFIDHVRHQKVEKQYINSFFMSIEALDPSFYMEMSEFQKKLDQTIMDMPEPVRDVFLLNRMEKLTYSQIAENLNLSIKTIEKRMQKALSMLSHLNIPRK
jgi:RNA polymerase sigma-70 factor (ECF subfamily)